MDTSSSFLNKLRDGLARTGTADAHVLIAASGGPDSLALLRGLLELRTECRLIVSVAHFNHRFRGADSDEDEVFVADLAHQHAIQIVTGSAAVPSADMREASARQDRYTFLEESARKLQANAIATGHTRDDQVETVLHHLFRGTGVTGLRGIPIGRLGGEIGIIRPMLDISRNEVLDFLSRLQQPFRTDGSNVDVRLTRNWLRHELLPIVRDRFPHADEAVTRLSMQARETAELTSWLGRQILSAVVLLRDDDGIELHVPILGGYPRAAVREALVQLWADRGWPQREMGYDRWNELADLVWSDTGAITLPGRIEARRVGERLVLRPL